ncbi:MAG: bacteriocin [Planctomyces sp.]|nr:bacteriocin [Planctomyces sp.]
MRRSGIHSIGKWAGWRSAVSGGVIAALLVAMFVAAQAAPPPLGGVAPDFELADVDGGTTKLSSVTEMGPTVLVVLRGFPGYQCPLCSVQVNDFLKSADAFKKAGARVIFVYPGAGNKLAAQAKEFRGKREIPDHFTLLIDPDYKFTNQYGLRWNAPNETAYPATFVLDGDRKIVFSKVSDGHGGRTTAKSIVEQLSKMAK